MALVLKEDDVERLVDMDEVLAVIEHSMRELGEGKAQNQPRRRVFPPGGVFNVLFASYPGGGHYGLKSYSVGSGDVRFLVTLHDLEGRLAALIEANLLGAYRTGAATAVAVAALAPTLELTVALLGTGRQATTQALALGRRLRPKQLRVFSRSAQRREAFPAKLRTLRLDASAAASAELCVRDADVVVCMTTSAEPVLEAEWVKPGAVVVGAGSNYPNRAELPPELIARSAVVVDQLETAKLESGDLIRAEQAGMFEWERALELGSLLAGKADLPRDRYENVVFESHGLALWDVAAGVTVLRKAREARIGTQLDLLE